MNDVAARALSPGINDPFTAMSSIDWLCALLSQLARKRFPEQEWTEGPACVRQAKAIGFDRYVGAVWDRLGPYVEKDRNSALHMLDRGLATLPDLGPERSVTLILAMQSLVEAACVTSTTLATSQNSSSDVRVWRNCPQARPCCQRAAS